MYTGEKLELGSTFNYVLIFKNYKKIKFPFFLAQQHLPEINGLKTFKVGQE
jgi:hypothetical protein